MPYAEGRIYNDADSHVMELPDWLPSLTIRNLRAGRGSLDLAFSDGDVEVLSNTSPFEVIHAAPPRIPAGDDR